MIQQSIEKKSWLISLLLHGIVLFIAIVSITIGTRKFSNATDSSGQIPVVTTASDTIDLTKIVPLPPPPPASSARHDIPDPKPTPPPPLPRPTLKPGELNNTSYKAQQLAKNKIADINHQALESLTKQLQQRHQDLQAQKIQEEINNLLSTKGAASLEQAAQEQQEDTIAPRTQGIIDKYKALILQAIRRQWVVPGNFPPDVYCELLIKLAPGGFVQQVEFIKRSGNYALDNSARAAIFRASPVPVPTNIVDFAPFKTFVLRVKPTDN